MLKTQLSLRKDSLHPEREGSEPRFEKKSVSFMRLSLLPRSAIMGSSLLNTPFLMMAVLIFRSYFTAREVSYSSKLWIIVCWKVFFPPFVVMSVMKLIF